jgi:hypothetical protein
MVNDRRKLFAINAGYIFINNEMWLIRKKGLDATEKIIFEMCLILPFV